MKVAGPATVAGPDSCGGLLAHEERVEGDGLRECHADDALDEDLRRGAGIAADGFGGLQADEARASAKEFLEKQTQESAAKANEIIVKAQQVIELEKRKMLAEARTEIARLVIEISQRVLAKEMSDAERNRYNESAARELTNA